MSDIDRDLYALFAQCCAVGLPLSVGLFADGETSKHELKAMLSALLRNESPQQSVIAQGTQVRSSALLRNKSPQQGETPA
jgi:hypothetical protein